MLVDTGRVPDLKLLTWSDADMANDPQAMRARLEELDREWDVERCLETGSASLTLSGLLLGTTVDRKWLWLSGIVQSFLMQHAIQGWCPPLPAFRALGVRTQHEIEAERHAIKAMLGVYENGSSESLGPSRAFEKAMS